MSKARCEPLTRDQNDSEGPRTTANGLERFFRLVQEARRLWRRYLVAGSKFVWNVSMELLGLKKFE